MTGGTVGRRPDAFETDPLHISIDEVGRLYVSHRGDFRIRPEVELGLPVTLEAPAHGHRFDLRYDLHLIDTPVTGLAADASVHVNGVAELRVVRERVHVYPFNRITGGRTRPNR